MPDVNINIPRDTDEEIEEKRKKKEKEQKEKEAKDKEDKEAQEAKKKNEKDKKKKSEDEIMDDVPEVYKKSMESVLEDAKQDWKTAVDRLSPLEDDEGRKLIIGEIAKWPGVFEPGDVEELVKEQFRGGDYAIRYVDGHGKIRRRARFRIHGAPKPTAEEMKQVGRAKPTPKELADKAKEYEKKRDELEAKFEYEKTRKDYEKKMKELENDGKDDDDDNDLDSPFSLPPFMMPGRGAPGMPRFEDPTEVERRLRRELELKSENDVLKSKLDNVETRLQAYLDAQEAKNNQPPPPAPKAMTAEDILKIIAGAAGVVTPLIQSFVKNKKAPEDPVQNFIKMADALGLNKDKKDDMADFMKQNMDMLHLQLKSGMEMSQSITSQATKTAMEIMKKSIMDAMGDDEKEPEDWRVALGKQFLDAGKEFTGQLFSFNKERLEVDKKKIDAILASRAKRLAAGAQFGQPPAGQSMTPTPGMDLGTGGPPGEFDIEPPPVAPPPAAPIEDHETGPQPQGEETETEMKMRIQQQGQNLFQAAVGAFSQGVSPEQFAQAIPEIAGPELSEWLVENDGLEAIKELTAAFGYGQIYDQFIGGNPQMAQWLRKTLKILGEMIYEEEEASGETIPPSPQPQPVVQQQPPQPQPEPQPAPEAASEPKQDEGKPPKKENKKKTSKKKDAEKTSEEKKASAEK